MSVGRRDRPRIHSDERLTISTLVVIYSVALVVLTVAAVLKH